MPANLIKTPCGICKKCFLSPTNKDGDPYIPFCSECREQLPPENEFSL